MNSRTLKKHLKYIVPEMRLALIKEPGGKPVPIGTPDDLEQFVAPLKFYSDYVANVLMWRKDQNSLLAGARHQSKPHNFLCHSRLFHRPKLPTCS